MSTTILENTTYCDLNSIHLLFLKDEDMVLIGLNIYKFPSININIKSKIIRLAIDYNQGFETIETLKDDAIIDDNKVKELFDILYSIQLFN